MDNYKIQNKNLGVVIFSRMSSKRLPGKALMKINNRELLGRVIDRSRKIACDKKIIVATSLEESDDKIVQFCKDQNVIFFRGSLNNLLERTIKLADNFSFKHIIRICGDRPFLSVNIIKSAIREHFLKNYDLTTTYSSITKIPPGLTTEIIKVKALKYISNQLISQKHEEHLTSYFYENPHNFNIRFMNLMYPKLDTKMRFVVDNKKDLENMCKVAKIMDNSKEEDWEGNLGKTWNHITNLNT